ncbi:MAG TPA: hypothetical protein VHT21_00205 [Stellaceae bacterium]|jgi:hypothetical protein|nr:hypothetical protein [Stellaceae bacterium]
MAYFDRAAFKILDNLIVISRHLVKQLLQVRLVNPVATRRACCALSR